MKKLTNGNLIYLFLPVISFHFHLHAFCYHVYACTWKKMVLIIKKIVIVCTHTQLQKMQVPQPYKDLTYKSHHPVRQCCTSWVFLIYCVYVFVIFDLVPPTLERVLSTDTSSQVWLIIPTSWSVVSNVSKLARNWSRDHIPLLGWVIPIWQSVQYCQLFFW